MCCPGEKELRNEWLQKLEKEHGFLTNKSKEIARNLKVLSNSDRIEILLMLDQREHCLDEISRKLKARKSAVSYHIGLLKKCGFICIKNRTRYAFYSLSNNGKMAIEKLSKI